MKKTSLFVLLTIITVFGTGIASFATCTTGSLSANGGVWGIESYGHGPSSVLDNILIQATFSGTSPSGTFTGTEWESVGGTFTGPTTISGTWSMVSPAADCQGTLIVTSPSTQTFNFALNTSAKGGTLTQTDSGYTMGGFMVQRAVTLTTCAANFLKSKAFSLYSYGTILAVGGLVTATGEIKFASTGLTFTGLPNIFLDLGGAGNLSSNATGTASIASNCTGSGSLTATSVGQSFSVDLVIVGTGNEALWIVNGVDGAPGGANVTGYFLQ